MEYVIQLLSLRPPADQFLLLCLKVFHKSLLYFLLIFVWQKGGVCSRNEHLVDDFVPWCGWLRLKKLLICAFRFIDMELRYVTWDFFITILWHSTLNFLKMSLIIFVLSWSTAYFQEVFIRWRPSECAFLRGLIFVLFVTFTIAFCRQFASFFTRFVILTHVQEVPLNSVSRLHDLCLKESCYEANCDGSADNHSCRKEASNVSKICQQIILFGLIKPWLVDFLSQIDPDIFSFAELFRLWHVERYVLGIGMFENLQLLILVLKKIPNSTH